MSDPFEKSDDIQEKSHRAVDTVREFMRRSEDYRRPFLDLAASARAQYTVWESVSKSITQRANLRLPYAYLIVESEAPQIVDAFLKESPLFKLKGIEASDFGPDQVLTDFMSQQLGKMQFPIKFVAFVKNLLLDGTAVAKVPYRFEEKLVTKRSRIQDPLLGISIPSKTQELVTTFDGPDLENIPLEDFFPDYGNPQPGEIQAMRGCAHRTRKTLSELKSFEKKNGQGIYSNLDELEQSVSSKGCNAWKDPYYKTEYSSDDFSKDLKKPIEVWEYWGLFDPTGNGDFYEYVITIANGDVEIRCEVNPYDYQHKPFVAAVNVLQPDEFYGVSELFAVRGLIKEATALRNSRLDQANLTVNRMWVVDKNSGINGKTLYARPNGIIYTNDMNGIRELPAPELPASSYKEIESLSSEIQQSAASTGGGGAFADAARAFGRSATGASFISSVAASRSGLKTRIISEITLKPLCQLMMQTNAQFVSDEQWVRISDPNSPNPFATLDVSAFHTNYDFEIATVIDENEAVKLQKYQQFMQIAQVAEGSQPGTINWAPVFEAIGRSLLGREVKRFVRSDQERMMMMYQSEMATQAANAQIGAAAPQPNGPGGQGNNV